MGRLISSELERFTTALWLERGLSDNTREAYSRDVQGLNAWLLDQSRGDALTASESDVQAYLGARLSRGSSHRSISRLLSSLRSFYQYLVREGDLSSDPTQHLIMIVSKMLQTRTLSSPRLLVSFSIYLILSFSQRLRS